MSLFLYTITLSVLYFLCLFPTFCQAVRSRSTLTPVDTSTHSLETIRLLLHADSYFKAKWMLQVAIVGNWMKKWYVNTDNTETHSFLKGFLLVELLDYLKEILERFWNNCEKNFQEYWARS